MTIQAVVFDIGGVLEITDPGQPGPHLGTHPRPRPGGNELPAGRGGRGRGGGRHFRAAGRPAYRGLLGLDAGQLRTFLADLWTEYLGTLNTELAAFFASLRPRYRTGIISNSFVGARHREEQCYGFAGMTDLIVYSHKAGLCKPDPRIYQLACDGLAVPQAGTVFLDDLPENVAAARQAGMRAVLFRRTGQAIADIQALLDG